MHPAARSLSLLAVTLLAACSSGRPLPEYQKPIARTAVQSVRTTAYTHSESDHVKHGRSTALGTTLRYGSVRSAAADWSRWPAGTQFRIRETGEVCEVDDYGWALAGTNTIDLYKPSRGAMNAWGVRHVNIEILRWGDVWASQRTLAPRAKHRHVERMLDQIQDRYSRRSRPEEPVVASAEPATYASAPSPVRQPTPRATGGAAGNPFFQ